MVQAKINRELASLGADLTSTRCYIIHSKSKINSTGQDTEKNNVLLLWEPPHNNYNNALRGAATSLSLLSPHTDNSISQHINQSNMKCYYDYTIATS